MIDSAHKKSYVAAWFSSHSIKINAITLFGIFKQCFFNDPGNQTIKMKFLYQNLKKKDI